MVSPGLAGVVDPGYKVAGPMRLPSAWVASTYGDPPITKKAGETGDAKTV
jgi:hypothetical protein